MLWEVLDLLIRKYGAEVQLPGAPLTFSASQLLENMTGIKGQTNVCGDGLPAPGDFQRSSVILRRRDLALKEHCVLLETCIFMPWLQVRPGLLFLPGKGIRLHRIMQHIESSQLGNNLERGSGLSLCDWRETGALWDSLHKKAHNWPTQGKLKPVHPIAWHQGGLTLVLMPYNRILVLQDPELTRSLAWFTNF